MVSGVKTALRSLLEDDVEAGRAPGVAVAVRLRDGPARHVVVGADAAGRPLAADTLFPVASITKLATALAVLRLADAGELTPADQLSRHLPDAAAAPRGLTLRSLLTHTSGLPGEFAEGEVPYDSGLSWPVLAAACLRTAPVRAPGTAFEYGNIGYGLLGLLAERSTGKPLSAALAELVFEPLGIEAYLGIEPPRAPALVAGISGSQTGTSLEPLNSPFWRSLGLPWGGLVTTAAGALALVRAYLGEPAGYLQPETVAAATRDQTDGVPTAPGSPYPYMAGPWGLGPELSGDKPLWAPPEAGSGSFGHAGSSGCVAWAAPGAGVAWAALCGQAMGPPDHWLFTRAPAIGRAVLAFA